MLVLLFKNSKINLQEKGDVWIMQKRIIHFVPKMDKGGGIENFVMNYYRYMNREEIQFKFIIGTDEVGDYNQEIEQLGGEIVSVVSWRKNLFKNIQETARAIKADPTIKVSHIHVVGPFRAVDGLVAKLCGQKVIFHSHSMHLDYKKPKIISSMIRRLSVISFRLIGDEFLACSPEAGQSFFGNSITKQDNFTVVKNAIETAEFAYDSVTRKNIREELGVSDHFVIGQVGRFSDEKNQDFTLAVFKEVLQKQPMSRLLLVGDGPIFKEIKQQAQAIGISEQIIFTGLRTDVNRLLQGMDVLIQPSKVEGLGIALIEAQASGLPCLVSTAVPKETKITNRIEYLSLEAPKSQWVNWLIQSQEKFSRLTQTEALKQSGYEIETAVQKLSKYYQKVAE